MQWIFKGRDSVELLHMIVKWWYCPLADNDEDDESCDVHSFSSFAFIFSVSTNEELGKNAIKRWSLPRIQAG